MKNSKIITIAVILLVVAALVIVMSLAVSDAASNAKEQREEDYVTELVNQVNSYDYSIYWIGTPPQYLTDNIGPNINVLTLNEVTSDTLPVSTSLTDFNVYDEEGNLVSHIPAADYPDNMLIVIGSDVTVDEIHWDIIRRAIVGNSVPCLVIGDSNINDYRDRMFLTRHSYSQNGTMLYDKLGNSSDNPLTEDSLKGWMLFLLDIFDSPAPTPVVVATESVILIEVPTETEETVIIEETDTPEETQATEIFITEELDGN